MLKNRQIKGTEEEETKTQNEQTDRRRVKVIYDNLKQFHGRHTHTNIANGMWTWSKGPHTLTHREFPPTCSKI